MRWIPAARSRHWFVATYISAIVMAVLLNLIRFELLEQKLTLTHALRFTLLALALTVIPGLLGWFGARLFWLFAMLGNAVGLALMAQASRAMTGWEDLTSLLMFLFAVIGGYAVGLVAELIQWVVRAARK
ncbi:hypothetical protein PaecuDRAFT_2921 [Paenibacillus curdlanolyticus YK9]|uniref:Uncharacterized protein n=1 Tax=Paenibacillus curdlanolyticus YK9 TaxID=717606 RepID=E0IAT1_9BACL|nr:hypothetical protein [Paenibacillus curdlanolyticus]EFM10485.1 hypothetical protein PaecuDRAFT_2921 [Paenibacillus curdlanolyticus YK9]